MNLANLAILAIRDFCKREHGIEESGTESERMCGENVCFIRKRLMRFDCFRMNASGDVKGLVVCNDEGYLYSASGTMNEGSAAVISQLSLLVGQLETNEEDPGISISNTTL